ncbi:MAG: hypothetical protein WA828_03070, partial [Coleofasciculaceae cyanobacterium]
MKRLFPSTKTKPRRDKPRRQGILTWLLRLGGALILVFGISTTVVFAQSDKGLKQQEDQLIRQIVPLPKAPTQAPVYRPAPAPPPRQ